MIKHLPSRTVPVVVLWLPRLEIVGVGSGRCQALSQMILPCCFIGLTLKKSKSTHNSLSYQTVRLSNTQLYWENKEIHLESSLQQGSVCKYNWPTWLKRSLQQQKSQSSILIRGFGRDGGSIEGVTSKGPVLSSQLTITITTPLPSFLVTRLTRVARCPDPLDNNVKLLPTWLELEHCSPGWEERCYWFLCLAVLLLSHREDSSLASGTLSTTSLEGKPPFC